MLAEGTVYPILNRLRTDGLVQSQWVEAEAGHPRKYYLLTPAGRERATRMAETWTQFSAGLGNLIDPVLEDRNMEQPEMTPETQVNDYLARLRAALTGMTVSEREDIVEEIRMHIRERLSDLV